MDSPNTPTDAPKGEWGRTHAATSSFGSSLLSFHTVHSTTSTPRGTFTQLRRSLSLTPGEEREVEGCSTPIPTTPTGSAPISHSPDALSTTQASDEHIKGRTEDEERQEELAEKEELGHAIKPLPNGMMSLPSPSVGSRSFDCSSPFSRPLTLVSLAPTDEEVITLKPVTRTPPSFASTSKRGSVQDESSVSSSTAASFHTRPSATYSDTTSPHSLTPTSAVHLLESKSSGKERQTDDGVGEWASRFWTVIQDPRNPSNVFFANPTTGECRWELPRGTIVLPPREEGEWWELWDESAGEGGGREYYWHTKTKQCRWERPAECEGMVVPMRAVQARHFAPAPRRSTSGSEITGVVGEKVERGNMVEKEEESGIIVTTPLRPRTKSLPRLHHQHSHPKKHNAKRALSRQHRHSKEEDDYSALQATRSILLRDQRALELARKTSGPPFRTDPLPTPPLRRRVRPSTTGTPTTTALGRRPVLQSVSTSRTYPFLAPPSSGRSSGVEDGMTEQGKGAEGEVLEIRKIGKGLAYDPSRSASSSVRNSSFSGGVRKAVKGRKSLPFLHPAPSGIAIENKAERKVVVELPADVASALVNVNTNPIIRLEHSNEDKAVAKKEEGKDKENPTPKPEATKETKLTKLISWTTLARCKRSASLGTSPDSSLGIL